MAALAALLLVGCHEGRNHEMRQQPANVDTLVFDEAYYERMWLFEAVEAGRCCGLAKCSPAGTRTTHFDRPHYRTALGWQGKSVLSAKTMTAAA